MDNILRVIFPTAFHLWERQNKVEVQNVKQVKQKEFKLDGRMARWIRYRFMKNRWPVLEDKLRDEYLFWPRHKILK